MIQYHKNILEVPEFFGESTLTLPAYGITTNRTYTSSFNIPGNRYARILRIENLLRERDQENFGEVKPAFGTTINPTFQPFKLKNNQSINVKVQVRRSGTTSTINYRFEIRGTEPAVLWQSQPVERTVPDGTRTLGGGQWKVFYEQFKLPREN